MIEHDLRIRLGCLIEDSIRGYERLYEADLSGVNDVKHFFYTVADFLKRAGFSDNEVLEVYRKHGGNYLLVKKYGVTARDFADRLIEKASFSQNND